MRSRLLMVLCLFVCLLLFCLPVLAQDEEEEADGPYIEWTECPFDVPEDEVEGETLDCGYLVTYEDYFDDEDTSEVQLAFVILYSLNEPAPGPVIYLEGGPGGSAISGLEMWALSSVRHDHDFILFDQRGTGFSMPSLNCIEVELNESDDSLVAEQACFDRFMEEGINVNAYNTLQSSTDIAQFIALLQEETDYSEFNLLGISYGTRLALNVLRDYPENIRSVILDSVYPPNVDAYENQAVNNYNGLRMLFDGCDADPDCANAYPDLEAVFYDTYESLNGTPAIYETEDEDTGEVFDQQVDGDAFLDLIVESLYSTTAIPELPLVIYEVSEGNYSVIDLIDSGELTGGFTKGALRQDDEGDISDSEGMFNAVECIDELPFNDMDEAIEASSIIPDPIRDYMVASIENQFMVCELYGLEPADTIETEAISSDVPALVLAGDYDPITPPSDAQIAAETLSNSYYFEFPGYGHGITDAGDCANGIIAEFLEDPTSEPDGSCIADIESPAFVIR